MGGASFVLAHVMGIPVEETVLFGLPPIAAAFGAWRIQYRARREASADGDTRADVGPSTLERDGCGR